MDISIIIPLFNERENVKPLLEELYKELNKLNKSYEVIFIDDGSTDGSFEELCRLKDKNSKIIRLSRNFGQTAALQAGFDEAQGDLIITMDGDMQNDPSDITRLIEKIKEGVDIVSGWRKGRQDPLFTKKIPSAIANRLIASITKVPLHDFGCTLKIYKKEVIKEIHLFGEMHRFLPALLAWKGAKVAEIEVAHRARKLGKSKYGISRILRVILDLIGVKFLMNQRSSPIQVFGILGVLSFVVSILSGISVIIMKFGVRKMDMTGNPLLYLAILMAIVGGQFIILGLLGEAVVRAYYESKPIYTIKSLMQAPCVPETRDRCGIREPRTGVASKVDFPV